ncbi:MAG: hypothetical protein R3F17_03825 [Planctomycetota bacterium]
MEEVARIDGMVKLMLEMFAVPYIPVESLSMQERLRTVAQVLRLAGLPTADERRTQRRAQRSPPRGGSPHLSGNKPLTSPAVRPHAARIVGLIEPARYVTRPFGQAPMA